MVWRSGLAIACGVFLWTDAMNRLKRKAILRDISDATGPGLTRHFHAIARRRRVSLADVIQVHEDERKRRARTYSIN